MYGTKKELEATKIICIIVIVGIFALILIFLYTDGRKGKEALLFTETSVLMEVTAYCPGSCCCGKYADGITASGFPATGTLVAAPPDIPFGTLVSIPGYAGGLPVPVRDRGGSIKGNRLDVLFPDHNLALKWGRKSLKVRFEK